MQSTSVKALSLRKALIRIAKSNYSLYSYAINSTIFTYTIKKNPENTCDSFTNTYIFKKKTDYIATSFPFSFLLSQMIDIIITSSFQKSFFPLSSRVRLVKQKRELCKNLSLIKLFCSMHTKL